jgi:hypothetical protein
MAKLDTLWTCVGITEHTGSESNKIVRKVRLGVDIYKRVKSAGSPSYIKSKGERMNATRRDFITLPHPMLKLEALTYALGASEFQSSADQALIQEQIDNRTPRQQRVSITSLKTSRKSKVTAIDILNAIEK